MAVYTDVSDADLRRLLADFDLGEPLALTGISEGVENSNFRLQTEAGQYFLTVFERRVDERDLPYFLELARWLSDRGFPCATPVADREGQLLKRVCGKPAALVGYLSGRSVVRPGPRHCFEAGAGLAKLHLAAQGFTGQRANALGEASWPAMFARLRPAAAALRPGLEIAIADDLDAIARGWPRDLPRGTVHADYFPDNVFFLKSRFSAAFDFYFACDDALAYDLAVALNAWAYRRDGTAHSLRIQSFLDGYQSIRPLTADECSALPMLMRGAAMRFFLTRLNDWGSVPEGALVRPKDPMEYARKLATHRQAPPRELDFG